jgi:hypothetical protein
VSHQNDRDQDNKQDEDELHHRLLGSTFHPTGDGFCRQMVRRRRAYERAASRAGRPAWTTRLFGSSPAFRN